MPDFQFVYKKRLFWQHRTVFTFGRKCLKPGPDCYLCIGHLLVGHPTPHPPYSCEPVLVPFDVTQDPCGRQSLQPGLNSHRAVHRAHTHPSFFSRSVPRIKFERQVNGSWPLFPHAVTGLTITFTTQYLRPPLFFLITCTSLLTQAG